MFSNLNFQIFEPQNLEKDHFSELVTYWTWIPFKDQLAICLTSGTFFRHFLISGALCLDMEMRLWGLIYLIVF